MNTAAHSFWRLLSTPVAQGACGLVCCVLIRAADANLPPEAPSGEAPTNPPTLQEIRQAFAKARTIFAHFTQERHLALFQEPLRSEGFLCSGPSGHLRWEVTQPYRSILVSDGRGVAQFEWIEDRWQKLELGLADALQAVVSQIGQVVQGSYATGQEGYEVSVDRDDSGPVLTLIPRADRIRRLLQSVDVHLAADLRGTRRVVLRETTGDFTTIDFDNQRINAEFPAGTFDRRNPLPIETVRGHLEGKAPTKDPAL